MASVLIDTKLVGVTPAIAKEWAAMKKTKGERDLRPARVEWLRRLVDRGEFTTCTWARVLFQDTYERLDGWHSSAMLAQLPPVQFPPKQKALIETWSAETLEEVALLFLRFNNPLSTRTQAEAYKAMAGAIPRLAHIPKNLLSYIMAGIVNTLEGKHRPRFADQKLALMHEYPDFIRWAEAFVVAPHMRRAATVGAMLLTFRRDKADAADFWGQIREGENAGQPATKTRDYLLKLGGSREKVSPRELRGRCIHGWNAFRSSQRTTLRYYVDKPDPQIV